MHCSLSQREETERERDRERVERAMQCLQFIGQTKERERGGREEEGNRKGRKAEAQSVFHEL